MVEVIVCHHCGQDVRPEYEGDTTIPEHRIRGRRVCAGSGQAPKQTRVVEGEPLAEQLVEFEAYGTLSKAELVEAVAARGLAVSGTKPDLVARLEDDDAFVAGAAEAVAAAETGGETTTGDSASEGNGTEALVPSAEIPV